jgi:hypothetical protein
LDELKFSGRRLPDNGQGAIAATGKIVTVEFCGVNPNTNREVG